MNAPSNHISCGSKRSLCIANWAPCVLDMRRQRQDSPSSQDRSGSGAEDKAADSPGSAKQPELDELRQKALERMQSK